MRLLWKRIRRWRGELRQSFAFARKRAKAPAGYSVLLYPGRDGFGGQRSPEDFEFIGADVKPVGAFCLQFGTLMLLRGILVLLFRIRVLPVGVPVLLLGILVLCIRSVMVRIGCLMP